MVREPAVANSRSLDDLQRFHGVGILGNTWFMFLIGTQLASAVMVVLAPDISAPWASPLFYLLFSVMSIMCTDRWAPNYLLRCVGGRPASRCMYFTITFVRRLRMSICVILKRWAMPRPYCLCRRKQAEISKRTLRRNGQELPAWLILASAVADAPPDICRTEPP